MAGHWVDVDKPGNPATVHRSDCLYARVRRKKPEDGYWRGYQNLKSACLGALGSGMDIEKDGSKYLR